MVRTVEKIETAVEPRFQEHFVDAMAIPQSVTVSVDSCRFFPAATSPCRLPACRVAYLPMPGPRALCSRMSTHFSARAEVRPHRCPAPCPEPESTG